MIFQALFITSTLMLPEEFPLVRQAFFISIFRTSGPSPLPPTFPYPSCLLWDTQDFYQVPQVRLTLREPSGQGGCQVLPALLVGAPHEAGQLAPRVQWTKGQACTMAFRVPMCLLWNASRRGMGRAPWVETPEQK